VVSQFFYHYAAKPYTAEVNEAFLLVPSCYSDSKDVPRLISPRPTRL